MSWKVWTGKYQEEIRHLRGLIDEIDAILDDHIILDKNKCSIVQFCSCRQHGIETRNKDLADCINDILEAIEETQNEYEGARKDE